ncbi:unnamed protein product [Withania somnifera]
MSSACGEQSSATAPVAGGEEIMLFGVRVKVDPMRKSVSLNNLSQYEQPNANNNNSNGSGDNTESSKAVDEGYASADDAVQHQSNCGRERKRGISNANRGGGNKQEIPALAPAALPTVETIKTNAFPVAPAVVPIMLPAQIDKSREIPTLARRDHANSSVLVGPAPMFSMPNPSTVIDLNANDNSTNEPLSLSLRLSLSLDQGQASSTRYSGYQVMSSFNNGESIISVA